MDVRTKQLHPDDWREWRSVRLAALADTPSAFGARLADWIDAPDERWRSRVREVPLNVIAELDGTPVGQVSATSNGSTGAVELISMWVSPAARGAAVGDALIDAVVSWAINQSAGSVELSVKASNSPARRLYERCGFAVGGDGCADDEIRMVRRLH